MRVLVTGGLGFIGSNFINWFLKTRQDVFIINIDKCNYCANSKNVTPDSRYVHVQVDITDQNAVKKVFDEHQPDVVIHYAAQSHVDASFGTPIQYTIDNVLGTHILVHVACEYGRLKKFIHISTDEVYGEVALDGISHEKSLLNPTNPYAASKAAAEFIVKSYGHSFNFPWIITRGNNVFGPRQYPEKLIPKFILKILHDEPCTIHGNGDTRRNFIYVDDVSRAVATVLDHGQIHETYNIGSESEYSVREIFEKLRVALDPEAKTVFVPDRPFNDFRYCIDAAKLKELGWSVQVPFDEGLQKTIEWYTTHQDWWAGVRVQTL
jgi:dTDP-glucose 4,6-dehydratase